MCHLISLVTTTSNLLECPNDDARYIVRLEVRALLGELPGQMVREELGANVLLWRCISNEFVRVSRDVQVPRIRPRPSVTRWEL